MSRYLDLIRAPSLAHAAGKARTERVARLATMLERRLENPSIAIDVLLRELAAGDAQPSMWEGLHVAATRAGVEDAVAEAYSSCTNGLRMNRLAPEAQCALLMHAADFAQRVLGDVSAAGRHLVRVLALCPGYLEAYLRLERRFEQLLDKRRLVELYASVATAPPKAPEEVLGALERGLVGWIHFQEVLHVWDGERRRGHLTHVELLSTSAVASRAAATLQAARRSRGC